jgi:hypothetical protein
MLLARVSYFMSLTCVAIRQCPWNLAIECPIEYPCDPLPWQGVTFQVKNWHSLTLTANLEFNPKGWSIGDSNPGPRACQASAEGLSTSSAAVFEIESRSSVCLLRT